jgi:hypothetical protein
MGKCIMRIRGPGEGELAPSSQRHGGRRGQGEIYIYIEIEIEIEKAERETIKEKLSFGFKGEEAKLKSVITLLNNQVDFLNESKCSTEHLVTILTSKALTSKMHKVYFGCETVQLRYIIDELKYYFNNLTPTALEKSGLFYTKTNKQLKAQNLYSNKIESPKKQPNIDKIINQMQ